VIHRSGQRVGGPATEWTAPPRDPTLPDHGAAPRALNDIVTRLAAHAPDTRIFTFLHPERDPQSITAGQLHRDATQIAAMLHQHGVQREDILPLAFDHSYELVAAFWGAMYLGAVPAILPYVNREAPSQAYAEQVARLARFANAATVVTMGGFRSSLGRGLAGTACRILALPSPLTDGPAPNAPWCAADPSDTPYIQFSSGTTGSPKGVVQSHAALLHYLQVSSSDLALTPDDVTVGWLPLYHDMGLVNQILQPLFFPHHSVLMSPAAWMSEPHRLLRAIHDFRGTISWMPNFAFRYCTRRIRYEQIAGIDLSSWRVAGNASEPVLLEDVQSFAARFAAHGLRGSALTVSYGLAEHVAGLTWTPHDRAPDVDWVREDGLEERRALPAEPHSVGSRPIVSCGNPLPTVAVRVVDGAAREVAEREIGEVLARSPLVFRGYYLMPDESALTLQDGWLRTGDLGYIADGQLYVCGRQKDLIIVGGRNIYPNHLEAIAASVLGEQGRFAAAFGVPNPHLGTEMPILVCEMREVPDEAVGVRLQQEIRERIERTSQLYVGDVHLVDRGWIVRTTSGKINRAATRGKYLAEKRHTESKAVRAHDVPRTSAGASATERRLIAIWETVFARAPIHREDDFFALGGDSLLAALLTLAIEEHFQCSLPPTALLEAPTISGLARVLERPPAPVANDILVPLRPANPSPRRPVFFCVHGLGGGVLDYRPLSDALGAEQPFYALQAPGFDGTDTIGASLEAMAARYVQAVKAFQPEGPYHLGGYCFGGVVAYEMARQLTEAAETVSLVAILEGYAPIANAHGSWAWREWQLAVNFVREMPYWLRDYLRLGRLRMQARNRRLIRVAKKRLMRLAGWRVEVRLDDVLDHFPSRPAHVQKVLESHLAAAHRYAPTPYAVRVVLFRTPHRLLQAPEQDMGWSRLSTEPVDVQMIAGSHATILQEPHVRVLAAKLKAFLS
jgi:fatty-acyl-CoA synthase